MTKKKSSIAGYMFIVIILIVFVFFFIGGAQIIDGNGQNMSTDPNSSNYSPYASGHNLLSTSIQGLGNVYVYLIIIFIIIGGLAVLKYVFKLW